MAFDYWGRIKSLIHLTIHVGFASHNADWNWKEVSIEVPADALDLSLCRRLCEINPTMKLTQSPPTFYDNNSGLIQNIMRNKQRVLCDRVESRVSRTN